MLRSTELLGIGGAAIMLLAFILLIIKRNRLGQHSCIFIAAMGVQGVIEGYASVSRALVLGFNPFPLYIMGIGLFLFGLFHLYFRLQLHNKRSILISNIVIIMFVIHQIGSIFFQNEFPWDSKFHNYIINIFLLAISVSVPLTELLSLEKILTLEHYFPFYACLSVMITYVSIVPLIIAKNIVPNFPPDIFCIILALVNIPGCIVLFVGLYKAQNNPS